MIVALKVVIWKKSSLNMGVLVCFDQTTEHGNMVGFYNILQSLKGI